MSGAVANRSRGIAKCEKNAAPTPASTTASRNNAVLRIGGRSGRRAFSEPASDRISLS